MFVNKNQNISSGVELFLQGEDFRKEFISIEFHEKYKFGSKTSKSTWMA